MSLPKFETDSLITKRYQVIKPLGRGAMGTVYLAKDKKVGMNVAVKLIDSSVRTRKTDAARVHQEIRFAYSLDSEYVTSLYDVIIELDYIGLVLEYIEGETLFDAIMAGKQFSLHGICSIGRQVSLGLKSIHDAGVIHRDIKLENIILSRGGIAKITDFGISLLQSTIEDDHEPPSKEKLMSSRLTNTSEMTGTMAYLAPEYVVNHQIDERTDIYALGVLLYELTTSLYPYEYRTVEELIQKKLYTDPERPSTIRPECPEWLDRVIMKAMCRNPEYRYESIDEIISVISGKSFNRVGLFTGVILKDVRLHRDGSENQNSAPFWSLTNISQCIEKWNLVGKWQTAVCAGIILCLIVALTLSKRSVEAYNSNAGSIAENGNYQLGYQAEEAP